MKKGLFPFLILVLVIAAVSVSGCLSMLTGESDDSVKAETVSDVLEIYELNVFVPTIKGEEKIGDSGTYFVIDNSSATKAVRLIDNQKDISLLNDTGLLSFGEPAYTDIYLITSENFSMTAEGVADLLENPELSDLNYSLKNLRRSPTLELEENFSGVLLYTYYPDMNGTSLSVNDGADAVQIILPDGTTTGNRIIGTPRPAPDSNEYDENGRQILIWNNPTGSVSVKYYSTNAPFYLLIAFSAIFGAIIVIFLWYQYQIRKLRAITNLVDDEKTGFRKQK